MDIFKEAIKQKLRVKTIKGELSVEQLWDLSLNDLDTTAQGLEEAYEKSGKKSFLVKKTTKDKNFKLQLDIVVDILQTRVDERDALAEAREIKEHNAEILELIADKQKAAKAGKSIKQLESMLR